MIHIIYHSRDLDGYTSGAILKKRFPEAVLHGYDYGQPIPVIEDGHTIIMVDVSLPMDDMFALSKRMSALTWIDHHISAINDFRAREDKPTNIYAILQDGIAACEIAWQWAFPNTEIPYVVTLLGMYDTWRNKDKNFWDNQILPFQFGMRTICSSAESFPESLFNFSDANELNDVVQLGNIILDYQREQNARQAKNAFTFNWMGYRVIAINGSGFNSQAFESVYNPELHDLMMPFVYNGSDWTFSIYTEKEIDCSALARTMGGGGHRKAAGFKVKERSSLPFTIS